MLIIKFRPFPSLYRLITMYIITNHAGYSRRYVPTYLM